MVPSVVLTANAWLSPGPGARGLSNGNTHESPEPEPVPAWVVPPAVDPLPAPSLGTSTSASCGCERVGRASPCGQAVTIRPYCPGLSPPRAACGTTAAAACWSVPPS